MSRGVFLLLSRALLAIIALAVLAQPLRAQSTGSNETRSYRLNVVFTNGATFDVIIELSPQLAYHFTRDSRLPGAEAYTIDGMMYVRSARNVWKKFHIRKLAAHDLNFVDRFVHAHGHFDVRAGQTVVEDGVTYGVAHTEMPIPLVYGNRVEGYLQSCSYDLTTFRPHTCTTSVAAAHFSAYNDPANEIELPAAAYAARLITLPVAK